MDVYLSGHDHGLQLNRDTASPNTAFVVSGGGGYRLHPFVRLSPFSRLPCRLAVTVCVSSPLSRFLQRIFRPAENTPAWTHVECGCTTRVFKGHFRICQVCCHGRLDEPDLPRHRTPGQNGAVPPTQLEYHAQSRKLCTTVRLARQGSSVLTPHNFSSI